MKRTLTLTASITREWFAGKDAQNGNKIVTKMLSILESLFFNILGFGILIGLWYLVSLATKGELPTPVATFQVLWELVKDPFYDYGPNDKGIALQLGSSLSRVFSGFLLGAVLAIPVGLLMGASAFSRRIFYPIVQILRPVSRSEERRV